MPPLPPPPPPPPPLPPRYYPGFPVYGGDMFIQTQCDYVFRVYFEELKVYSAFFRDMPEHSWELSGTSEKLIHLDATPEHFAKLLKFLYTHPKFDWPDLHIVAELGARLQFEILPDIIVGAAIALLRAGNESGAFGMFEYAAQNDKPHLAKIAIASFGSTSFGKRGGVSEIDYALFTHIPGSYTAALLKGMASHFIGGKRNWSPVSDSFHVK